MGKRFVSTDLFKNDFVRAMSKEGRDIWVYLLLNVDLGGFIHLQFEDIRYQCDMKLTDDEILEVMAADHKDRIVWASGEKPNRVWVKNYIFEQTNFPINPLNHAHRTIMAGLFVNADRYKHDKEFRFMYHACCIADMCETNGDLKKYFDKPTAIELIEKQKRAIKTVDKLNPPALVMVGSTEPIIRQTKRFKDLATN